MQFHPKDLSELDELTEEHLGFSALSDGLGFSKQKKSTLPGNGSAQSSGLNSESRSDLRSHLPENRAAKLSMGSGAMSAGSALPAPAAFLPPRSSASASSASASTMAAHSSTAAVGTSTAAQTASPLTAPAAPALIRSAAFLLDFAIVFFPLVATWIFSFGGQSLPIFLQNPQTPLTLFAIIFVVYFLLSESFGGQSLGKMALGLRIVEDDKYEKPIRLNHTVFRLVAFVFGSALLGAGLWMSFRDSKKRPWHDRYTGTIVRKKS